MGICGSCGMMVNGEPKLTCATFLADYAPGPVRVEPLRNFPVIRDLDRRHRRLHAEAGARSSHGSSARRRSRCRRASTGRRRRSWTSTSSSACASTACCATPPARSTAWTRSSSARPPSRWRSATTSTPATRAPTERMEVLSEHEGIWGCTFVGECTKVCPKHVDPAGAIQRYKLTRRAGVGEGVLHAEGGVMSAGSHSLHRRTTRAGCGRRCRRTGGCRSRSYFAFILRELSSVFVAWFVVYLLMLVRAVSEGDASYQAVPGVVRHGPLVLLLNIVSLLFVVLPRDHVVQPAPQAMVVHVGPQARAGQPGRRLPLRGLGGGVGGRGLAPAGGVNDQATSRTVCCGCSSAPAACSSALLMPVLLLLFGLAFPLGWLAAPSHEHCSRCSGIR